MKYLTILRKAVFTATIVLAGASFLEPEKAFAIDLGKVGRTYPIAERDASEELNERVRSVDWQKILAKNTIESMKHYRPETTVYLPRAREDRVRMVDMTYTLEFDISDGKGKVVYPKGYTFNPLDFMNYIRTIVVISGTDRAQVEWFKTSPYYKKPNAVILITDGYYYDLSEELGQPVYYMHPKIASCLQLQFVPAVAVQKKRMMEVSEIAIDRKNETSGSN